MPFIVWGELFAKPISAPCPTGLCATNIYTGEKRCPSTETDIIMFNPIEEVCNVSNGCTNPTTPCLYYDVTIGTVCPGSSLYTQLQGVCPTTPPVNPVSITTPCKCMT